MKATNRQWCLVRRPTGRIREGDFSFQESPIGEISEGEALVRVLYLSLDPTNRVWIREEPSYLPPVNLGEVMRGIGLGVVESSRSEGLTKGDLVQGLLGWQDFAVMSGSQLTRIQTLPGVPLTAYLGLFGHIGLSAYFGLLDVGRPRSGETLVVSAAAGAVGSLVCQIGLIKGCRVVGIAGSEEKCRYLTETLGVDAAVNYKRPDFRVRLKRSCPSGVDVFFDNVGGEMLETVLNMINLRARIVLCGMISQYNASQPAPGPSNLARLLMLRGRMEGFIVLDYLARASEAITDLAAWWREGRLRLEEDIVEGLEEAPMALNKLFDGSNRGKLLVRVSNL